MSAITPANFRYICDFIRDEAAIVLEEGKEYLVETRLASVVRDEGLPSIDELVLQIKKAGKWPIKQKVVDALTTNETSFFRDITPFEILRTAVLPDLIEKRKETKSLTIWCGAASSGQEPYTFSMMLRENFPQLADWNIDFLATDISQEILEKAKRASYNQLEVNRGLPAMLLVKYFEKIGTEWRVKENIRKTVRFKELNLIKPFNCVPRSDIVMLRNVLIYFDQETKRDILARVREVMRPDGYLFLGAAETTLGLDEQFSRKAFEKGSCYVLT
jgi:chemotaxis protein methyltransferase CheR